MRHEHIKHDIKRVLDTVIHKARNTSLNTHLVKWDSVQSEMYNQAVHAKTVKDLKSSFEVLLNSLNDRHGKFIDANTKSIVVTCTRPNLLHDSVEISNFSLHTTEGANAQFEYKMLDSGIGYLKIVNIPTNTDLQKEAQTIRNAVDSLDKNALRKWVIDLRYIDGKNINPIIAGIAPLLGEGQVGGTVDGRNRIRKFFEVHDGNFYDNQRLIAKLPRTKNLHDSKIAVLISKYTANSGEIVAITLKGRKNTKFFGEPTRGCTASTNWIYINHDLIMSVSESLFQDRKGNIYTDKVNPDVFVASKPTSDGIDEPIIQAIDWLEREL